METRDIKNLIEKTGFTVQQLVELAEYGSELSEFFDCIGNGSNFGMAKKTGQPQTIIIYGASDDLVELDGAIVEEFGHEGDDGTFLLFSDGTILRLDYNDEGIWKVSLVERGPAIASIRIDECLEETDNGHSDRATITTTGSIDWVLCLDADPSALLSGRALQATVNTTDPGPTCEPAPAVPFI